MDSLTQEIEVMARKISKIIWFKEKEIQQTRLLSSEKYAKGVIHRLEGDDRLREMLEKEFRDLVRDSTKKEASEIPDYLLCKITFDLMERPAINQSGVTYEREILAKHYGANGEFDPITREKVDGNVMIPNYSIKAATNDFLERYLGPTFA
eukprot:TRINITY_DN3532_c0_g1_i3.p2 TRINITY_DN3532_c0_g1~~TRINITY_DN3532_c0_g1_i3.p2  ORF type:complete len:151 (+),score=36.70 TRINITY_DN3532_c0_g1_i3:793-1245(+)